MEKQSRQCGRTARLTASMAASRTCMVGTNKKQLLLRASCSIRSGIDRVKMTCRSRGGQSNLEGREKRTCRSCSGCPCEKELALGHKRCQPPPWQPGQRTVRLLTSQPSAIPFPLHHSPYQRSSRVCTTRLTRGNFAHCQDALLRHTVAALNRSQHPVLPPPSRQPHSPTQLAQQAP